MDSFEFCPSSEWSFGMPSLLMLIVGVVLFGVALTLAALTIAIFVARELHKRVARSGVLAPGYVADLEGGLVDSRRMLWASSTIAGSCLVASAIALCVLPFQPSISDGGMIGLLVLGALIVWALGYVWLKAVVMYFVSMLDELATARDAVRQAHAERAAATN